MNYHDVDFLNNIIIFALDEPRFAIYLSVVERVVQSVEITPLPNVSGIVLGVINVHGQIVPILDIRKRLNLPQRNLSIDDQFILAHTSSILVALCVDSVNDIQEIAGREIVTAEKLQISSEYIRGVVKLENNLILICDLDQFLSLDEEKKLVAVMDEVAEKPPEMGA
ncbi:MAG TPA: chemotaxis protein CheW [Anaerovoracaceae bacterium]|nr:chemotaxis protein CheW [Anaerovoracaceae bacterium]